MQHACEPVRSARGIRATVVDELETLEFEPEVGGRRAESPPGLFDTRHRAVDERSPRERRVDHGRHRGTKDNVEMVGERHRSGHRVTIALPDSPADGCEHRIELVETDHEAPTLRMPFIPISDRRLQLEPHRGLPAATLAEHHRRGRVVRITQDLFEVRMSARALDPIEHQILPRLFAPEWIGSQPVMSKKRVGVHRRFLGGT